MVKKSRFAIIRSKAVASGKKPGSSKYTKAFLRGTARSGFANLVAGTYQRGIVGRSQRYAAKRR